eukprot:363296-Chlamydomonas_euryale.AAC.2
MLDVVQVGAWHKLVLYAKCQLDAKKVLVGCLGATNKRRKGKKNVAVAVTAALVIAVRVKDLPSRQASDLLHGFAWLQLLHVHAFAWELHLHLRHGAGSLADLWKSIALCSLSLSCLRAAAAAPTAAAAALGKGTMGCGNGAKAAPPSGGYRPKTSSAFGGYARKVGPPNLTADEALSFPHFSSAFCPFLGQNRSADRLPHPYGRASRTQTITECLAGIDAAPRPERAQSNRCFGIALMFRAVTLARRCEGSWLTSSH